MNEELQAQEPTPPSEATAPNDQTPPEPTAMPPDPVEELRRTVDQLKDQLLRRAAEFENYKRRTEADMASMVRFASERLLRSLLPVLDDFDRTLKAAREKGTEDPFVRGVELVAQKLTRVLQQEGLEPFTSIGEPFDVAQHDALLQVPRADVPPHTVVEEAERGYRLHDRVLRHAKVVVSAPPASDPGSTKEEHG